MFAQRNTDELAPLLGAQAKTLHERARSANSENDDADKCAALPHPNLDQLRRRNRV